MNPAARAWFPVHPAWHPSSVQTTPADWGIGPGRSPFHGLGEWSGPAWVGPGSSPFHGLGFDVSQALTAMAPAVRSQIRAARFRSTLSPEIAVDPSQQQPRTASQGGVSEVVLRWLQPAWYLDTSLGTIKLAPWGEPTRNYFGLFVVGLALVGATVVGLMIRGIRR